jgi:hypothetical protein
MQVCRLTFSVDEVSINPCLINSVELSLVYEEIGLAQRPSLCYRQTIQLVADFQQSVVLILEPLINFALSVFELVSVRTSRGPVGSLEHTAQAQFQSTANTYASKT